MLNNNAPCQNCQHKDICKYSDEAYAAYCSLEKGHYIVPEHDDRAPGDLNTAMVPYRASEFLTFTVSCKYFHGEPQVLTGGQYDGHTTL